MPSIPAPSVRGGGMECITHPNQTLKTKQTMTNKTWLASKLYSTHPDDSHLRVVIRDRAPLGYGNGWVVHTYNDEQKGYGDGDYCETWQEAIAYFNKRGSNR